MLGGDDTIFNLSPRLEGFAQELGIADRVRVLPNLKSADKQWLYSASDVFVSLSDNVQETFGITLLEAMVSGLPVIASDWDGYREAVIHNRTGFLVPTYWADCVEKVSQSATLRSELETHKMLGQSVSIDLKALAGYMEILCENPQYRRQMGEAARLRVIQQYSWSVVIKQYEDLWEDSMNQSLASRKFAETSFQHGINSFDYLKVFRHYPSDIISHQARLKLSSLGRKLVTGKLPLQAFRHTELAHIPEVYKVILKACQNSEEITVQECIQKIGDKYPASDETIFQYLARLLKYGILELTAIC